MRARVAAIAAWVAIGTGACDFPWDFSAPYPGDEAIDFGTWAEMGAGSFLMGSPASEPGRVDDEEQHAVALWSGFQIMTTEVTRAQFEGIMGYAPSSGSVAACPSCPVDSVSWHEAAAYANRVSELKEVQRCYDCSGSGRGVSCALGSDFADPYECPGYRLPTEAEFEYAARAGTTGGTYAGTVPAFECPDTSDMLDAIAWYCGNSDGASHPVAQLEPNDWALCDMLGNVWEWTNDWYAPYEGDATDPWGPSDGVERTMRGGCHDDWNEGARAAARGHAAPELTTPDLGFRLARTI